MSPVDRYPCHALDYVFVFVAGFFLGLILGGILI
jgi:hypothetical protein